VSPDRDGVVPPDLGADNQLIARQRPPRPARQPTNRAPRHREPDGDAQQPARISNQAGFKETVKVNPGQVTVVRAKFTPPSTAIVGGQLTTQKYVHHCHIVEHEDNDMMERVIVQP
jgi:FtsP/CotA-like multicopper oxidase with cupredoxin domain